MRNHAQAGQTARRQILTRLTFQHLQLRSFPPSAIGTELAAAVVFFRYWCCSIYHVLLMVPV